MSEFSTVEQQASYGIGRQIGDQVAGNPFEGLDANAVAQGVVDALNGAEYAVDVEDLRAAFGVINERMQAAQAEQAKEASAEGQKFLDENDYHGFSAHFDAFKGDGRFEQINMLAASNLMAEGYGYGAEGDTNTASLVAAGHVLEANAHFTEMYAMDFKRKSILMSHMGEGNWKIARKDRSVRLANRTLDIGGLENPPTAVFMAEPGPATIVSLVPLVGDQFRLVVSYGEILNTEEYPTIEMPHFHFKPASGLRECNDGWLKAGGTHHQVLHLGDQRQKWRMLCNILGIEYKEV